MRYRDAKVLHNGDEVIRKEDKVSIRVQDIEVYGQYKKVRINGIIHVEGTGGARVSLFHDEVE